MRIYRVALAAALLVGLGNARLAEAAEIITPSNISVVQTVVALAPATDTVLGSSTSRRYLCLMNIGTGLVNLGFDQAAVGASGWAIEAASASGHQGGAMCWESAAIAASAVHAISAAGSTVVVLEGR